MHITAVTEEKKGAPCKVCLSEAFLASAGTLQPLLAEVYNTVIDKGKTAKFPQVLTAGNNSGDPSVDAILGTTVSHTAVEELILLIWLQPLCSNCREISFAA